MLRELERRASGETLGERLYWAGYEGVLFDDAPARHPAVLPDMRDRTVVVGGPSFEQRMIVWRIGWVVAPGDPQLGTNERAKAAVRPKKSPGLPGLSLRSG